MRWFMERFRVNSGIIELLNQYLIALANRGEKIWWVAKYGVDLGQFTTYLHINFICNGEVCSRVLLIVAKIFILF